VNSESASGNVAITTQTVKNANNATISPTTSQVNAGNANGNTAATSVTVKNANNATVAPDIKLLLPDKAPGGHGNAVRNDLGTGTLSSNLGADRSNKGGELRGLDRANFVAGDHGQRGRDIAPNSQDVNQAVREIRSVSQDLSKDLKEVRQDAIKPEADFAAKTESGATATNMRAMAADLKNTTLGRDQRDMRPEARDTRTDFRDLKTNSVEKPERVHRR
jgi:hypothetical protein